ELPEAVERACGILEVVQDGDPPRRCAGLPGIDTVRHECASPYWLLMLAALMTRSQRAKSWRSQSPNSLGPRPACTAPSLRSCSAVSGFASASLIAWSSFATMAGGVPAGASRPTPGEYSSNPLKPASSVVGRFGK